MYFANLDREERPRMLKRRRNGVTILFSMVLICFLCATTCRGATRKEIQDAIDEGCKRLVALQNADGSWKDPAQHGGAGYDIGRTALATLALQHGNPKKYVMEVNKGVTFITQNWPEPKTYTFGLVQQVLWKQSAGHYERFRRHIDMYAWMGIKSQKITGPQAGAYSYGLFPFPKDFDKRKNYVPPTSITSGRADNSNTQFGYLGLVYSEKCGVQVPKIIWKRGQEYYIGSQHQDGGWDYQSPKWREAQGEAPDARPSTHNMTFAGTISLYLCNEMLYRRKGNDCDPIPESREVEKGLDWIKEHWNNGLAPYGWYACERLGILTGYSEFGGTDWYDAGADRLIRRVSSGAGGNMPDLSFGIIFLSRGLEPIIINKLKRTGDWEIFRYDVKRLTDYISTRMQKPSQWRIVTLEADVDYLLRVPILSISGYEALQFTDDEKRKLQEYVNRGGTILAEACCGGKKFDQSFRALLAELWPDAELMELPKTHPIYNNPRPMKRFREKILGMALKANQGRLAVIYFPYGKIARAWDRGGAKAGSYYDIGTNIHFYVEKIGSRLRPTETAPGMTDTPAELPAATPPPDAAPSRADEEEG